MPKDNKKEALRRLAIINGHLHKVKKMVEESKYCIDILNQSLAVQRALRQVDTIILDKHLHSCVRDSLKGKGMRSEKAIKELLELYDRSDH